MADLTTQLVTSEGLDLQTASADAEGDTFEYGSILVVVNESEAPMTVSLVTPGTVDGDLAIEDREVTVPNGETRYIKATNRVYRDPETGLVSVTYSDETSVSVAAVR